MDVTGLQWRCWQGWFLLDTVGENQFPCLFKLLGTTCILGLWPLPSRSKPGVVCPAYSRSLLLSPVPKPGHQSQFQIQNSFHFPTALPVCVTGQPKAFGTLIRVIFLLQNIQHSLKVGQTKTVNGLRQASPPNRFAANLREDVTFRALGFWNAWWGGIMGLCRKSLSCLSLGSCPSSLGISFSVTGTA